ncbi:MAG: hypothetical protein UU77_C0021G0007 [candidate division WWE3 bacterium GW2011_GWC1_41_7]|uniref:Uncharacterized protein n=4 Tax=Katanobacteria TaxID=422282 RepID=A0A0G0XDC8_UNCKA|nr:MAG: hypothetical protein UU72_C0001G0089 [candidate division WWE3 bacterium GW2011_GWB1_41_6]KKS20649.1 MAG: hypothetical protein UU77_C0021G0007 [candidate division WWE3 bacterium GW2011_GWC1_41_7]KKS22860.1 MAG: hypothetical protein UU80_C0001G0025 [candidate division WWE3 bacterium GW2011_GWA1_41_8]OGC56533.1 MAG: hypothetical protein A2976_02960 [candidate division WWE3 bacterium RIFCSPLOWO2_01_FULL_41_9]
MKKYATTILIVATIFVVSYLVLTQIQLNPSINTGPSVVDSVEEVTENVPADALITGSVVGDLCYPSSFLPSGSIDAKNVNTGEMFNMEYPGSTEGGANNYIYELPVGTYILRYITKVDPESEVTLSGYHTNECPTGSEGTCSDTGIRTHKNVQVSASKITEEVDLCDFYYAPGSEPQF